LKIVHLCLSCFYIDDYSYQENQLVSQNVRDGHDVLVIASTETYDSNRQLTYVTPSKYLGSDGAWVIRLPYRFNYLPRLASKLRAHPGVFELLEGANPDVILFHGMCGWELVTVAAFARAHPNVRVYADSHEDRFNSARGFFSRWFLHYGFYRSVINRAIDDIDKVLCVNVESMEFVQEMYGVPQSKIEYFPLGGIVFEDEQYQRARNEIRMSLGLREDQKVFVQSGKMDASKGLVESLTAFSQTGSPESVFLIVGYVHSDIEADVLRLAQTDSRIRILGWKSASDLQKVLCAADVFVQPRTQSATTQMGLCCRCAIIISDVKSHRVFWRENGWLVSDEDSIQNAFRLAVSPATDLAELSRKSLQVARDLLDYRALAARLYV
jgi:1,2-diacylglycerol 3-alpha-glucosyltransferase